MRATAMKKIKSTARTFTFISTSFLGLSLLNLGLLNIGLLTSGLFITQSASAEEKQITLNLKDADINALISTVAKFTGKNFVVDPRIKANVTVISSKTMSEGEVYEVFLSVLQVHGYAAVPVGSIIKIVPEVNAKQGPLPLVSGAAGNTDELITKVITLNYVPAAQLVPILRPLVPQQGHLAAYNPTNTLIITDHAANIRRLVEIIRSIDRQESDELEIIPLKHASASELVRIINSLNSSGAKTPDANKIILAADDRTNSILMSGERSDRLKIRATIAHLDTPLDNEAGNTHVIYLKYAKASDIVTILTGVQKNQEQADKKGVANKAVLASKNNDADIQADDSTNALIITAGPDVVRRMKSIIRQLDIRRAQVLVESIIAEISNNRNKEFSSQFALAGNANSNGDQVPVALGNFGGSAGIIGLFGGTKEAIASSGALGDGLSFGFGSDQGNRFAFLLKALSSDAATNILSTPSVVTMDNQEAEIVIAQNVPFVTGSFTTAADGASNPFQTIERQDVGITLKVTPQINEGSTIKLDIQQEVSNVAASAADGGIITNKRSINTSVLVEDGEILVLGGLIDDTLRDNVSKVPLLGDIPLLGWLFRSHSTSKEKQNLMVFMRPSIMRNESDAAFQTNQKYNYLRAQQIDADEHGFGLLREKSAPLLPELVQKAPKPEPVESMNEVDKSDF